jgi:hypothetical protein
MLIIRGFYKGEEELIEAKDGTREIAVAFKGDQDIKRPWALGPDLLRAQLHEDGRRVGAQETSPTSSWQSPLRCPRRRQLSPSLYMMRRLAAAAHGFDPAKPARLVS